MNDDQKLVAENATLIAEQVREARDDQTFVVLRALRRVLEVKTTPQLIEAIIEDVQEELRRG